MRDRALPWVVAGTILAVAILAVVLFTDGEDTSRPQVDTSPEAPASSPSPAATPSSQPSTSPPAEPSASATATGDDGAGPEATGDVELTRTDVATGLEAPWAVAFTDDGRAFVTERDTGRLLALADGEVEPVQRIDVDPAGEGGLLGLTTGPDGATLYAYLSSPEGDNRIVRFAPGRTPEPVLTGIPHASIHNGGRLAFGPDGMLYVGTGDAGNASSAQDPTSLGGKILRITPDGDVPDDNPSDGSPVWSFGHRNVQGLAFDADGRLWASEFGPDRDDEINVIEAGGNYGWPEVTGRADRDDFVDPVLVRQPPEASWSGIAILVDGAVPQWEGDLLAASLRGERLYRLDISGNEVTASDDLLVGELGRLRAAVQAPDGSLWILTSNRDGRGSPRERDDRIVRLGP